MSSEVGEAYVLLANIFLRRPDASFEKALAEQRVILRSFADSAAARGRSSLRESALRLADSEVADAEALAKDFTKLLRGVRPLYGPRPPYESVYCDQDADVPVALSKAYAKFGLTPDNAYGEEPADHLAYELSCIGQLHLQEDQLRTEGKRKEADEVLTELRRFARAHPARWIASFREEAQRFSKDPFYINALLLAEALVQSDAGGRRAR